MNTVTATHHTLHAPLPTVDARIHPHGGLDVLSRDEVARLRDVSSGGMHALLRGCALAVLTSGSASDDPRAARELYPDFDIQVHQQDRGVRIDLLNARHLLESASKPRRIVLTIQKEVAQRICAQPGEMSLLALSVQVYGKPHIAAHNPAEAFFPAPKVDSAVLCMDIYPAPLIKADLLELFFKLIKAGFSQKRKTLRNSLSSGLHISPSDAANLLTRANIDPQRRARNAEHGGVGTPL